MALRKSDATHDWQLTDAELEIAHQIDNADLKKILRREGAQLGRSTAAFTKLLARVRVERMLKQELLALAELDGQIVALSSMQAVVGEARKQVRQLEKELMKERSEHTKELAAPAMAVHSIPGEQD